MAIRVANAPISWGIMFSLIALGTGVAYLYSLVAALAPGLFPPALRGMDGAVAVYFEAAAVITVLVLVGQVLELRARAQTGGTLDVPGPYHQASWELMCRLVHEIGNELAAKG